MSEQAITLAMTEALWDELTRALDDKCEVAGVLSAQLVDHGDGEVTLLGRNLTWAPADTYVDRFADGLALTSPGWVPAARTALAENSAVVFIHTHPHGHAVFSSRDDTVDAGLLRAVTGMAERANYAALVIAGTSKDPAVAARLYGRLTVTHGEPDSDPGSREPAMVDRFRIVGDRVRVLTRGPQSFADDIFDRQVLAFGRQGQATLADLHVGVVGAGGTGSAVAEQLSRLGVGRLTLIDDDVVTAATPTRGYGMTTRDTGRAKATVLAEHIEQIGFGTKVTAVIGQVQDVQARRALARTDIVFSCVDGHGARLILNRWAFAHLAPVIDTAVLVGTEDGTVAGIDARVTWLAPGTACLLCRGRLDPALAYAEMLDPDERHRLAGEGYVRTAGTAQPAVISLTSLVSSLAVTETLMRLFGLADTTPSELLMRITDRDLRKNRLPPRQGCFCSDPNYSGRGFTQPHLDLMWP
jgi:molybdopterin/thiamine biosynthesis adenylyltransferase